MATPPTYNWNLKQAGNGFYRDTKGNLVKKSFLDSFNNRFGNWAGGIGKYKMGDRQYDYYAGNIKKYGDLYGYDYSNLVDKGWKPGTYKAPVRKPRPAPTAVMPGSPDAVDPNAGLQPVAQPTPQAPYQSAMTKSLLDAMRAGTNTMSAYEPKNFEGSPLYQFQKQKGLSDMEKLMSSRGLTGSGAEVQANSDFLANLNAQEAEKQRQYADQQAQRNQAMMQFVANFDQADRAAMRDQANADINRRIAMQQFEAGRSDQKQTLMTNFLQNLLQLQGENNIASLAYSGLGKQSDYQNQLMQAIASFTGQNFKVPSGGGGGGGAAPMPPMSPDLDIMRILAGYSNSAGNSDAWNNVFKTLFPTSAPSGQGGQQ